MILRSILPCVISYSIASYKIKDKSYFNNMKFLVHRRHIPCKGLIFVICKEFYKPIRKKEQE